MSFTKLVKTLLVSVLCNRQMQRVSQRIRWDVPKRAHKGDRNRVWGGNTRPITTNQNLEVYSRKNPYC